MHCRDIYFNVRPVLCIRLLKLTVLAEYEVITLERLKEVQAQAEAAKVKVAEADALDAAVQLLEDFQVDICLCTHRFHTLLADKQDLAQAGWISRPAWALSHQIAKGLLPQR